MRSVAGVVIVLVGASGLIGALAGRAAADAHEPHVVQIAVAHKHTCARLDDGTVRCWGENFDREVGDGTNVMRATPVPVPGVTHAVDLALGRASSCARTADGTVLCWGARDQLEKPAHEPAPPASEADARVAPVAGLAGTTAWWPGVADEACARGADRTTRCWGESSGSLAAGHPDGGRVYPTPVIAALAPATSFALGSQAGCAVMPDGTARCWGANRFGGLGDGTTTPSPTPVTVAGLAHVAQIVVMFDSACARLTDGTVRCWGANDRHQLGDGTRIARHIPVGVTGMTDAVELASGDSSVCARRRGGAVTCWGEDAERGVAPKPGAAPPVAVPGLAHVTQIAASNTHVCALRADGSVWCWGGGAFGVLGDGLQTTRATPVRVVWAPLGVVAQPLPAKLHVARVALASDRTCAVLDDGTGRCWGHNEDGVTVPGGAEEAYPIATMVPGLTGAADVMLDDYGSRARLASGHVVTWGGKMQAVHAEPGAPVAAELVQARRSCTLAPDGVATCTSLDTPATTRPARVEHAAQIAASALFGCARLSDGTVVCAGENTHGELGDGTTTSRETFAPVSGLRGVVQIAVGLDHACARLGDGSVKCWGDIMLDEQATPALVPVEMKLAGVVDIASGAIAACARKSDHTVACWGRYDVGGPTETYSAKPVDVPWLRGATAIVLGTRHACAVLPGGLACWGENQYGQLGDGTNDARPLPSYVRWQP